MPQPETDASEQSKARDVSSQLVLVVEDNERNARLCTTMLQAAGYQTVVAMTGQEGLRLACETHPVVALVDLQMPGMDGLELMHMLRLRSETANMPAIAVSAHALEEHRQAALKAGCCSFLTKPFRYQSLIAEVTYAVASRSACC